MIIIIIIELWKIYIHVWIYVEYMRNEICWVIIRMHNIMMIYIYLHGVKLFRLRITSFHNYLIHDLLLSSYVIFYLSYNFQKWILVERATW